MMFQREISSLHLIEEKFIIYFKFNWQSQIIKSKRFTHVEDLIFTNLIDDRLFNCSINIFIPLSFVGLNYTKQYNIIRTILMKKNKKQFIA